MQGTQVNGSIYMHGGKIGVQRDVSHSILFVGYERDMLKRGGLAKVGHKVVYLYAARKIVDIQV